MSYRPITDVWLLTRARLKEGRKYYGAYLGGFPERARRLIGVRLDQPLLHLCGGMARHYPYFGGFGPNDHTLDLDPATKPDFHCDARLTLPLYYNKANGFTELWPGILIDPPYSESDAEKYVPGSSNYPSPNQLVRNALAAVEIGGKVGIIHYIVPQFPKDKARCIALIAVNGGFNNRMRAFTVYERLK